MTNSTFPVSIFLLSLSACVTSTAPSEGELQTDSTDHADTATFETDGDAADQTTSADTDARGDDTRLTAEPPDSDALTDTGPVDPGDAADTYETTTFDGSITHEGQDGEPREVKYRLWVPLGATAPVPAIIVSHGGSGSTRGHTMFRHLGAEYAAHGFAAIHLNHARSGSDLAHRFDRPADVSAIIDHIADGSLALPDDLGVGIDANRIGHVGHSWGAYTSHAVAGAVFEHGSFRDARVRAFVPLSPQGWGGLGAYDETHDINEASSDNSWMDIRIPAYTIIGEDEMNRQIGGGYQGEKWRLFPFARYPVEGDKFATILPGQNHGDIGNVGSAQVKAFIAQNTRRFFEVYVADRAVDPCAIGTITAPPELKVHRKFDAETSALSACAEGAGAP